MAEFTPRFQSAKQDWSTPQSLFDPLNQEFNFKIDLAANKSNTKCRVFYSEKDNALSKTWLGNCWLNPPYGKRGKERLANWVAKAYQETQKNGCTVVMLIPARTNTRWWHQYCMQAHEIRFVCGRPKFDNSQHGLPLPLAVVIFKKQDGQTKIGSLNYTAKTKT